MTPPVGNSPPPVRLHHATPKSPSDSDATTGPAIRVPDADGTISPPDFAPLLEKRCARISLLELFHETTKRPESSPATLGFIWLPTVATLTWNSVPSLAPLLSNRWPKTPNPEPSWFRNSSQTTTNRPDPMPATDGRSWMALVNVLTRNSAPSAVPELE
jgi:hypothetical protein